MTRIHCILLCLLAVPMWGQIKTVDCSHGVPRCPADGPACQCGVDSVQYPAVTTSGSLWQGEWHTLGSSAAPLKCGKYQHVYHWPGACGPTPPCEGPVCTAIAGCSAPPPDRCVDDMHEVTEREWRALLAEVKALQSSICVGKNTDILFKCKH